MRKCSKSKCFILKLSNLSTTPSKPTCRKIAVSFSSSKMLGHKKDPFTGWDIWEPSAHLWGCGSLSRGTEGKQKQIYTWQEFIH